MNARICAWTGEETEGKFYILATDGEPSELVSEDALRRTHGLAILEERIDYLARRVRALELQLQPTDAVPGLPADVEPEQPAKTSTTKAAAEKAK